MTQKYQGKARIGRGFTFAECKAAGLTPTFARTVGIAVDHRRKNKSADDMAANVARIKAYKDNLVLIPRRAGKQKKGEINDSPAKAAAEQRNNSALLKLPVKKAAEPEFVKIDANMKKFDAAAKCRSLYLEKRDHGRKQRKAELAAAAKK